MVTFSPPFQLFRFLMYFLLFCVWHYFHYFLCMTLFSLLFCVWHYLCRYLGMVTIILNDYPALKYVLIGIMGLFVLTNKESWHFVVAVQNSLVSSFTAPKYDMYRIGFCATLKSELGSESIGHLQICEEKGHIIGKVLLFFAGWLAVSLTSGVELGIKDCHNSGTEEVMIYLLHPASC